MCSSSSVTKKFSKKLRVDTTPDYTFLVQQKKGLRRLKKEFSKQSLLSKKLKKGYVLWNVLYQELEYHLQQRVNPSEHKLNEKHSCDLHFCKLENDDSVYFLFVNLFLMLLTVYFS